MKHGGKNPNPMTEQQISDFLRENPDFFLRHPELIEQLQLPPQHGGDGVVDLQNFMLRKLQTDNVRLRHDNAGLIDNGRETMTAQQRIHAACISVLAAANLEDLLHVIASDLPLHLGIEAVSLCFEAGDLMPSGTVEPGIQIIDPFLVDEIMQGRQMILRADSPGDPVIFGAAAELVQSDALLRLYISETSPDAMLAMGSAETDLFQNRFNAELLSFLGQVVEISIQRWLTDNSGE